MQEHLQLSWWRLIRAEFAGRVGQLSEMFFKIVNADAGEFRELLKGDELVFAFTQTFLDGPEDGSGIAFAATREELNILYMDDTSSAFHSVCT